MNIKLDKLRSFLLVAEERNLTRAAARRHSTPSAVSEHLRQLEEELQLALFERSKKGMTLTDAGEKLLRPVRQVFSAVDDVRNLALSLRATPGATLRLGLNSPPEYLKVDQILRRRTETLPFIDLEMRTRSSTQIIDQLLAGELDLGYVYGAWSDPRLRLQPLAPIQVCVAGPAAAPAVFPASQAERRNLPWIWPNKECPFHAFMAELLGPEVSDVKAVASSDDEYSTAVMVKTGLGFGLLEREFAEQAARDRGLTLYPQPYLVTDLSLVCRADAYGRAEIRSLFDLIAGEWQETEAPETDPQPALAAE